MISPNSHPNTFIALISGLVGSGAVYLSNKYIGTHFNNVEGGLVSTGFASTMLYIGREGIRNSIGRLWYGPQTEG